MPAFDDLTGRRFARLVALRRVGTAKNGKANWLWACDCGNELVADGTRVKRGNTSSCGCLQRQLVAMAKTIHGCSESGTWKSWVDMRARCYSKSNKAFRDYGGRGITVCDEWKESFSAFLRDMGERPDGLTLERIDVNGRYDKTNCKWADRVEQARNKRDNRVITFGGERRTLAEWSEITGIPHYVISARIDSFWSLEQALTQRPRLGFRRTTAQRASDESAFYATRYEVAE